MARSDRMVAIVVSVLSLGGLVGIVAPADSYEPPTHRELSAIAVDLSSLDVILKTQYRLDAGTSVVVRERSVRQWIAEGGALEDSPPYRAINHFHNPTLPWDQTFAILGESSIRWQQDPAQGVVFGGTWSWPEAQKRFLDFLTLSDPDARSDALARTARALGQVMHLIQDATSPPHTRNDRHPPPIGDGYERRIEELRGAEIGSELRARFDRLLALAPVLPSFSIFTATPDERAPDPIARLIDTDSYKKTVQSYTTGNLTGAAEYTNGGYASDDTIFRDFPLPRVEGLGDAFTENGRLYFPKERDGDSIRHFLTEGTLLKQLLFRGQRLGGFMLDDRVYEDYAEQLVPRAIGYSAGLLNYFFRSNFSFTVDPFDTLNPTRRMLRVQIPSLLEAEKMNGTFTLYADDKDGKRTAVPGGSITVELFRGGLATVAFTAPSGVRAYVLVFDGALGIEPRAVTGIVNPVGPFVFVIQETAELTGDESLTTTVVDNPSRYDATEQRTKDERTQRATGRFFSPSTTDPGKQLKRVTLEFDSRAVNPGPAHLLLDDVDVGVEWKRETSPIDNPRRWEIRFELSAFYGNFGLVPNAPRFVVTETLDGVKTKTPLVWWRKISTLAEATTKVESGGACPPALQCSMTVANSLLTQGLVFFGDGDGEGRDRTPTGQRQPFTDAHTAVGFIPTGSVAGYSVGTIDQKPLNCFTTCVPADSCSGGTINIFAGLAAQGPVWMKDEFFISVGDFSGRRAPALPPDACTRPTPIPLSAPEVPQLTFKRDYIATDQSRFEEFGVTPPAYEITLR